MKYIESPINFCNKYTYSVPTWCVCVDALARVCGFTYLISCSLYVYNIMTVSYTHLDVYKRQVVKYVNGKTQTKSRITGTMTHQNCGRITISVNNSTEYETAKRTELYTTVNQV